MALSLPPHPDGELPLLHTAACDSPTCRPRRVLRWNNPEQRNEWADAHARTHGHGVTSGTMRGSHEDVLPDGVFGAVAARVVTA